MAADSKAKPKGTLLPAGEAMSMMCSIVSKDKKPLGGIAFTLDAGRGTVNGKPADSFSPEAIKFHTGKMVYTISLMTGALSVTTDGGAVTMTGHCQQ